MMDSDRAIAHGRQNVGEGLKVLQGGTCLLREIAVDERDVHGGLDAARYVVLGGVVQDTAADRLPCGGLRVVGRFGGSARYPWEQRACREERRADHLG